MLCLVPADVFSLNSGWAGFYEYLGKRQAATVTVNAFNATTSRVNVTLLEQSGVHIKLSGKLEFSARFWHNVQWTWLPPGKSPEANATGDETFTATPSLSAFYLLISSEAGRILELGWYSVVDILFNRTNLSVGQHFSVLFISYIYIYVFCRHFYPKRLILAINVSFINICKLSTQMSVSRTTLSYLPLNTVGNNGLICECKVEWIMLLSSFDCHNEKLRSLWVSKEISWCAFSYCGNNTMCHWSKCCLVGRYLGVCSYILNMLKEKDLTLMGDGEWIIELALHLIPSVLRLHTISQMNSADLDSYGCFPHFPNMFSLPYFLVLDQK